MANYVYNKKLVTIKDDYLGNLIIDDRFINYQSGSRPTLKDILKWQFTFKIQRYKNKYSRYRPKRVLDDNLFNSSCDKIVWLGHASFLITINGKNILIDPVFKNIPMIKRRVNVPFDIYQCNQIDYILISHAHFDHLDKYTVKTLCKQNPKLKIYCGLNTELTLRQWGISNIIVEAGWWQQFPIGEDKIEMIFLPAQHWSNRSLKDRNTRLWGSFIIRNDQSCIYFMGDSAYARHFAEIGQCFSNIDYAIMGVGAYNPSYIMQSSHLNPDEAYQAFIDLGAKNFIPMHYGTFILADEPVHEPIAKTRRLFLNSSQLTELSLGEICNL